MIINSHWSCLRVFLGLRSVLTFASKYLLKTRAGELPRSASSHFVISVTDRACKMELQSSAAVPLSQIIVQHIVHPTSLQKQHWPFVSFFLSFVLILKDNWTDSALKMWYLQCDTCENPFVSFLISCNPTPSMNFSFQRRQQASLSEGTCRKNGGGGRQPPIYIQPTMCSTTQIKSSTAIIGKVWL